MIDRLKLKTKIMLLVFASLIGMALIFVFFAVQMKNDLIEGRTLQVRSVVETVYNTVADFQAQEAAGKLSHEAAQKGAIEAMRTARFGGKDGKADYVYAYTMSGVNVYHVRPNILGKDVLNVIKDAKGRYTVKDQLEALKGKRSAYLEGSFPRPGSQVPVNKLMFMMSFEPWGWMIGSGVYMDDIESEFNQRLVFVLSVVVVILLLIAGLGVVIARGVLRQVGGEPAEAIRFMAQVAAGDLTSVISEAPKDSMLASMGHMVGSIRNVVAGISQSSARLAEGAEQISRASHEVASASQRQSDATSSMAAAIEEMTVSINHISENAKDSQTDSLASVGLSEDGFAKIELASYEIKEIALSVSDASDRIRKLEERANQISSIAGVIKDIAGQTNLLALNAAIEAARAGEQGRGFAVVADEVRKLAERTSGATIEIEQMITGIQSDTVLVVEVMDAALPQVDAGVKAAEGAAESLRQIRDGAQMTLERIGEVAESTKEQSVASDSIALKVEEIATMVEETAVAMQSTAETAESIEKLSNELSAMVSRFRC